MLIYEFRRPYQQIIIITVTPNYLFQKSNIAHIKTSTLSPVSCASCQIL